MPRHLKAVIRIQGCPRLCNSAEGVSLPVLRPRPLSFCKWVCMNGDLSPRSQSLVHIAPHPPAKGRITTHLLQPHFLQGPVLRVYGHAFHDCKCVLCTVYYTAEYCVLALCVPRSDKEVGRGSREGKEVVPTIQMRLFPICDEELATVLV